MGVRGCTDENSILRHSLVCVYVCVWIIIYSCLWLREQSSDLSCYVNTGSLAIENSIGYLARVPPWERVGLAFRLTDNLGHPAMAKATTLSVRLKEKH